MEQPKAIFKIPVLEMTRVFFMNKYSDFLIDDRYINLGGRNTSIYSQIISFSVKEKKEKYHFSKNDHLHGPILELCMPTSYMKYGLEKKSAVQIGIFLDKLAKHELCLRTLALSSMPEFSVQASIEIVFSMYGITVDTMDTSHFRRYFDRYIPTYSGESFKKYSNRFNSFLKEWVENNPDKVKKLPSNPEK